MALPARSCAPTQDSAMALGRRDAARGRCFGSGTPGWGNSLLVTTLKNGSLYRFLLTADGTGIRDIDQVFDTVNRYRDLAIGPDNETIYVATDSSGYGRDAMNGATDQLANPGSILEFKFTGEMTAGAAKAQ
ncbi:MAG: PQQ-dependent sugar dehydrogenase [Devosia sp.]